ncbi:MAG TPA: cytochrome P460 family protein, partial [Afifellaceae bacterium]|nr:cytochrome P460 family protein [Afifellaceae bacterium]
MRFSMFVAAGVMSTAIIAAVGAGTGSMTVANAQSGPAWGPQWTADGELVLPEGFHEWVFVGSPLTPNALNDGQAGFPEYHNVYVRPEPLKIYRDTGEWPDGTIMLKELQLMLPGTNADGSREEASGRGFFPGALNGIDISVKDSTRFKDTNDWGFFNFGHHAPPYAETAAAAPADECAACHMANPEGMVF